MTDPSERCIAFLTERYIVAVHGNLFMDTPFSDELQKARAHLLEIIGGSLEVMAQGLIDKDYQKGSESLGEAVSCYLETIENLNASYQSNLSERQGGVE
ncbi:MAG: hypothetical protein M1378_00860 [Bacteroidetes bacterium]|nr:hypothetical protein [Bacteroidota bacterium]